MSVKETKKYKIISSKINVEYFQNGFPVIKNLYSKMSTPMKIWNPSLPHFYANVSQYISIG